MYLSLRPRFDNLLTSGQSLPITAWWSLYFQVAWLPSSYDICGCEASSVILSPLICASVFNFNNKNTIFINLFILLFIFLNLDLRLKAWTWYISLNINVITFTFKYANKSYRYAVYDKCLQSITYHIISRYDHSCLATVTAFLNVTPQKIAQHPNILP